MSNESLKARLGTIATRDADRMQRAVSRGGDLPNHLIYGETMESVQNLCGANTGYSKEDILVAVENSGLKFVSIAPLTLQRFENIQPPSQAEILATACEIGDAARPPLPPAADPQHVGDASEKIYTEQYAEWIDLIKAK